MSMGSIGASRAAWSFVRILENPWIRLIGPYSCILRGFSFFGSMIKIEEFRRQRFLKCSIK
jgi:hypothetical protein